ncbi:hypothetical protein DPMN_037807 [Dreissena polymorpha]|uniref:Uncharacterized protein n=1 Tax=Dreissena polymorpha TaxID=45954 RepID=A0A9D4RMM7_DREPO|nr:hypothetical protein DPMN_037807 [Dreissena polymorpha]
MQLAYFQHQNSLAVVQEAYYKKMASLADKLNVLADIAIQKYKKKFNTISICLRFRRNSH